MENSFGFWTVTDFIKRIRELEAELAECRLWHSAERTAELKARAEKAEAHVAELEDRLDKLATGDFDGDIVEFAAKAFTREREEC